MDLPVSPPVAPMLARASDQLPAGGGLLYEPKWDGFRTLVFRDGEELELTSRNERPLSRYFPELVSGLAAELPERIVVDGEVVVAGERGLDFDALQARIHPAASRVAMLAGQTPASFVAFDLLALDDADLRPAPLSERRRLLESALAGSSPPLHLTPATTERDLAERWFERFEGAGLDGVVAKALAGRYREGERGWTKVKHRRSADCVVGGMRWYRGGTGVGSLLLGLYDDAGMLHHVGVTSSFNAGRRRQLVDELAPYREGAAAGHPWVEVGPAAGLAPGPSEGGSRRPGTQSRWSAKRDQSWEPLRPELVCEVAYDQLQGDRFRHATTFLRWRPDRSPQSCTYSQLDAAVPVELSAALSAGSSALEAP